MTRARTRLAAVAISAGVLLAACSSGGGSGPKVSEEGKPYAQAIAKSFTTKEDADDLVLDDKQGECVGNHIVDIVGVDTYKEAGITPADLEDTDAFAGDVEVTEKQANDVYDSFKKCKVDLHAALVESMAQDEETSDAAKKCLEGAMTEDVIRGLLVSTMTGDEESPEANKVMGAIMGCMFMGMGEGDFNMEGQDSIVDDGSGTDTDSSDPADPGSN